jgi:predicted O-linked N-acetylglucosamine transferase (SPINDLY family)
VVPLYPAAVAGGPDDAEAAFRLGVLALQSGRHEQSIPLFARAAALAPGNPACHANLGEAQRRCGRLEDATDALLRAVSLGSRLAQPVHGLGLVLRDRHALQGALACFERAAELDPALPGIQATIASARTAVAQGDTSPLSALAVPAGASLSAAALMALARPLAGEGRLEDAARLLVLATDLQPGLAAAHHDLGLLYASLGRVREAAASYRRALEIEPGAANARHALASALLRGGRLDEALASFRDAADARADHAPYRSDVVFHAHFHPGWDARAILEEARSWDRAHAAPLAAAQIARPPRQREPGARLRVGYVSPNFRMHCQAFFLFPLLSHHDRERVEVFCYSDVQRPDDWTRQLLGLAEHARGIASVPDDVVAEQIRADGIDVLVDLTMHMDRGRLLLFARKPAPVQACWLAYPGTTGLGAMDFRLTDPHLDPPGSDAGVYSEESIRLPDTFWCYDPLARDDGVSALPAIEQGHVQFGCLNNFVKVSEGAIALWARVLQQVPGSRMTVLAPAGEARDMARGLFGAHGVEPGRIDFVDYRPRPEYLDTYRSIDLCLDTVPYGGHTTSLDAWWMGVPVVTLVGSTVAGRAGLSQAANLGLTELAAESAEAFVTIAVDLGKDLGRLAELRAGLRARMERSPLMDAKRFATAIEDAYHEMWRRRVYER